MSSSALLGPSAEVQMLPKLRLGERKASVKVFVRRYRSCQKVELHWHLLGQTIRGFWISAIVGVIRLVLVTDLVSRSSLYVSVIVRAGSARLMGSELTVIIA